MMQIGRRCCQANDLAPARQLHGLLHGFCTHQRSILGTGTLQNLVSPLPIVIPPPGSSGADDADHPDSLNQSLGVAAAACRAAILQLRSPGEILATCGKYAQAPYADVPMPQFPAADLAFSNWDRCGL